MSDVEADATPRTLDDPTPAEAAEVVGAAMAAGEAAAVVGQCLVRSADEAGVDDGYPAPPSRRHVLVKPDGSVVVHGLAGESAAVSFSLGGDRRVLAEGDRLQFGDGRLAIERPELVARFGLDDAGGEPAEIGPGAHASIRDRLLEDPDLVEPGFRARSTERETAAGPVDLFGRGGDGRAVVVEVKAQRAGPAAVGQLDRYVAAMERDLHADAEVRGVLVAPSATERTRALLEERGYGFSAVAPER